MTLTLADIDAARVCIAGLARTTPLLYSRRLSERGGAPVWLKAEGLQRTGSFKIRGAVAFIEGLDADARAHGVIAASAGNHAQGVAVAAAARGVSCWVVMPLGTALPKERATREYGAEVILHGADVGEAADHARALAADHGWTYVPPYDDPRIIAGQGTLGLELLEQMPDLQQVIVPVGGGGLAAGVGLALKERGAGITVLGVQAAAVASAARSHGQDRPLAVPRRATLADGCAVPRVGAITLPLLNAYVDRIVTVSEESIILAMVWLLERANLVVEGVGALGLAALLSGAIDLDGRATAIVLSGGNIDVNLMARPMEHGLARAGRYASVELLVADRPGELARILRVCSEAGANVLNVEHRRSGATLPLGSVKVELLLETRDPDHTAATCAALEALGFARLPSDSGVIRLREPGLVSRADDPDGADGPHGADAPGASP